MPVRLARTSPSPQLLAEPGLLCYRKPAHFYSPTLNHNLVHTTTRPCHATCRTSFNSPITLLLCLRLLPILACPPLVYPGPGIDFFCYPHFDSPSVFFALLDSKKGGQFSIKPGVPPGKRATVVGLERN